MPETKDSREVWDSARYEREKRDFVERRALLRPITLHLALIFMVTIFAGWFCSWLLLRAGATNMPMRYAVSFLFAYLAFAVAVRVWADAMRQDRASSETNWWDFADFGGDAEGCLVVVAVFLVSVLVAGLVTLMGGVPLLLEIAFEVVFAGVVVRRLGRRERIGDWTGQLVRRTWLPALAIAFVLVAAAGWMQHKVPQARTLAQAWLATHPKAR